MIQPGMALALANECSANDCGAKCASSMLCEGCGCCEIASPIEKCYCCGGGERAAGGKNCCMRDTGSADSQKVADEMLQSDETLDVDVIVISTTPPSVAADPEANTGHATQVDVSSTCHCGVERPPLGESVPARPTAPTRDSVLVRHSDLVDLFGESGLSHAPSRVRGDDSPQPHFAQIQLCIWRL